MVSNNLTQNRLNPPFSEELAQELLSTYGSPLYVYNGDRLRETIERITKAVNYPRTQFRFASVTNGNIALLKIFRSFGWGLHANTPGDIYLGLQAGFDPSEIVYSGSNLNRVEMLQVLNWGVTTLNFDSLAQLQLCCEVLPKGREKDIRLGLRLNLPEITGDSRIGVRPEEFGDAIALTHKFGLKLSGLHFYRGTGTNATAAFTQVIDTVIATAQLLPDWEYLDFGGGFGYPYHHNKTAFDWEIFGSELSERITNLGREIDLVIEPGRSAIAGCATLLAQVVSVKWQGKKQIVGVDTTVANLSVPSVHGGYREIITWKQTDKFSILHSCTDAIHRVSTPHSLFTTDICGNTTYSRDYLGKNCQLPTLEIGDIVAILDVGAYGYAMSSHFLHRPKPAEVLLENGIHRLIRQREDYSVLLTNQVIYENIKV
ncbi:MAG: diaminopimelate decarboxylase family protein [Nostoc sp. DedVER02]|uniref:diaminopimelate decarboxylase family protein n=1 Tax=unclassified Nostoc TaxID=2593658 RepID=UPI002AD50B40|nr:MULTISPECIES: decarboxylase [unclassified Nostoc]MDZ7990587.1 decarboxylase [Nostoc sp. DedVER02]MDZ8115099.1 decarboxylase [Nostoc sp. DedVER01b]